MSEITKSYENIKAERHSEGHFIARRIFGEIKSDSFSSIKELERYLDSLISAINDTRPYFIELQTQKDC